MRLLAIVLIAALLVPLQAHPDSLTITPSKTFYFRGDNIVISGKLVSGDTPIPNAEVYLYINGSEEASTTTADDGSFSFNYTIPLNRTAGTLMNITVYYPGDAFHYPSSDQALIKIYGKILASIDLYVINGTASGPYDSIDEEFTSNVRLDVRLNATFDNGSSADIDRYIAYTFASPSGDLSDDQSVNDTALYDYYIGITQPVSGTIDVYAYIDFSAFLFDNEDTALSKTFDVRYYDPVSIEANVTPGYVGGNVTVFVRAQDGLGYYDILRDAIGNSNFTIIIGSKSVEPYYSLVNNDSSGVYAIFNYTIPPCRGGYAMISAKISLPEYMKIVEFTKNSSAIRLDDKYLDLIFPKEYPNGILVTFVPLIENLLTGEERPLAEYIKSLNVSSGIAYTRGDNLYLLASGNTSISIEALANSTSALFYLNRTVTMRGIDVNVTSNATGTIEVRPNENFTVYVSITPRDFDVEAVANVTVGNSVKEYTFNGTLELTFNASQLDNNTMIEISLGDRNTSLLVIILAPHGNPGSPTQPVNPGQAASGQSYLTVLTIVLLALLIGLLVYLVYLIIKRLSKHRTKKKKVTIVTPLEASLQNLRRIYASGNYKLLAIEAYRFLVSQIAPRLGVTIKPNDTPRLVAKKLIAAGANANAVMTIIGAYEVAKYSPFEITEETAREILGAISAIIKTLPRPNITAR